MAEHLISSIEQRLHGLIELGRRNVREHGITSGERLLPTVTLTREFGCEGYPLAQKLQTLLEQRSGIPWVVMDKALLEAVAKDHHLSEEVFRNIGSKNRFLDDMLSTFSPRWKSDKDHYRLLMGQILSLAIGGNVILVGRGAAVLTQEIENCFHFRIVAPLPFRVRSFSMRMGVEMEEAERVVTTRQRQRDNFIKDFLGRDLSDPTLYHLIFNNARNSTDRMAEMIAAYVLPH